MNESQQVDSGSNWYIARIALLFGFLSGVGLTISLFILKENQPWFVGPEGYKFLGALAELASIPARVLLALVRFEEPYREGLPWVTICTAVVANGLLASLVAWGVVAALKKSAGIYLAAREQLRLRENISASAFEPRKALRLAIRGFFLGFGVTFISLLAPLVSSGGWLPDWYRSQWLKFFGLISSAIAGVFGVNLYEAQHFTLFHGIGLFSVINGIVVALVAPLIVVCWKWFLISRNSRT